MATHRGGSAIGELQHDGEHILTAFVACRGLLDLGVVKPHFGALTQCPGFGVLLGLGSIALLASSIGHSPWLNLLCKILLQKASEASAP